MKIEVSDGDVIDRAAILKVKIDRLTDPGKLRNVTSEYELLMKCMARLDFEEAADIFEQLYAIHQENWDLVEAWNRKDMAGEYDSEYIEITRLSNRCNRERFRLKTRANRHSKIVEEKSDIYGDYKNKTQ